MTRNTVIPVDQSRSGFVCCARVAMLMLGFIISMAVIGCHTQTPEPKGIGDQALLPPEAACLREGDVLRISFPGAPNLNTTQQIRNDGKITLPLVGEVSVVGMTPAAAQKDLINRYSSQLVSKEVTVAVESSSFPVYVTGAVLHPGKVSSNHPLSALEAIMEAGGFDYTKANLKAVKVVRHEGAAVKHYTLNLKAVLQGEQSEPFYLKPSDIVYVPERFSWF